MGAIDGGSGNPVGIKPKGVSVNNFGFGLIKTLVIWFLSSFVATAIAWFVVMVENYGLERMPELFMNLYEKQGLLMSALPALITLLYIIYKVRKYGSS